MRPARKALAGLENLVRSGESVKARRILRELRLDRLSRAEKLHAANLARRSGLPELSIKALNRLIRPRSGASDANAREKAEYAAALARIGATSEALGILEGLRGTDHPEVPLFHAFALISRWDYRGAIHLLRQHERIAQTEYQRLIGRVNLVAALVFERQSREARELLSQTVESARALDARLLLGNCHELAAQLAIQDRRFGEAERSLGQASEVMKGVGSFDELYVRKWRAVLEVRRAPSPEAFARLADIRKEADERGSFETVRDCDLHRAAVAVDLGLAAHLHYGTPFENYRKRLGVELGGFEPPASYAWRPPGGEGQGGRSLDLESGVLEGEGAFLKRGQLLHRLLLSLSSDFYRPFRMAALFATLFPGEYFNPQTSLVRVHQVNNRLRRLIARKRLPLAIGESDGHYRLRATAPFALVLGQAREISSALDVGLGDLGKRIGARPFSAQEAARALGVSERSSRRLLLRAMEEGRLERLGSGPATRYRLRAQGGGG